MRRQKPAGYTLIELMVSMAIFAMVMLAATAAYLTLIQYDRLAQTTASEVNTLSSDVDTMAREIRSGTQYQLDPNGDSFDFCFVNLSGSSIEYLNPNGTSYIERIDHGQGGSCFSGGGTVTNLTDTSITITNLGFKLYGQLNTDTWQPIVTIRLAGYACAPNLSCAAAPGKITFTLETSATQRLADLQ